MEQMTLFAETDCVIVTLLLKSNQLPHRLMHVMNEQMCD